MDSRSSPSIIHSLPIQATNLEVVEQTAIHSFHPNGPNPELNTSITDSDSVASYSESEVGSQLSDQLSSSSTIRPVPPSQQPTTVATVNVNRDSNVEIRAVHNVSEQHRRKYLKSCFDNLQKEVVPESTTKASHLLIITSALEAIQRVREEDFQLRRDSERALDEHRQLLKKLDDVVREILSTDPAFDVNDVLVRADLANPEGFHPLTAFDRHIDPFQIEETVEIVSPSGAQKRPCLDVSDEGEAQNVRKSAKMPALTNSKKKDKRGKNRVVEMEDGGSAAEDTDLPSTDSAKPETSSMSNGIMLSSKAPREPIPLRMIDEPDESLADPDVPLPILRRNIYNLNRSTTLTTVDRRKLAAERGLPVHLAEGVPALPGSNYWPQSLTIFPAFVSRSRPYRSSRKYIIGPANLAYSDVKSGASDGSVGATPVP
ncbi:uncharacterized protein LOC129586206 [Paramacrobiotus metropolitanus]|uniref:uncharacterized protein LOC129586206 n=1 Tax=Paramacrobiotus metropolitanus TaxID=2943436 RepID=UPI0024465C4F|nr:uncharacterized protein LOC129586206 [Paramacrobiotus metropolitanus]